MYCYVYRFSFVVRVCWKMADISNSRLTAACIWTQVEMYKTSLQLYLNYINISTVFTAYFWPYLERYGVIFSKKVWRKCIVIISVTLFLVCLNFGGHFMVCLNIGGHFTVVSNHSSHKNAQCGPRIPVKQTGKTPVISQQRR